ncbi:MAG: VIT domain-containing protein, partial [Planctomycetota bacterium]
MKTRTPLLLMFVMLIAAMGWMTACGSSSGSNTWAPATSDMAEQSKMATSPVFPSEPMAPADRPDAVDSEPAREAKPLAVAKPGDDIWVIVKPPKQDRPQQVTRDDDYPGAGAMVAMLPPVRRDAEPRLVPMPLKHTDVKASVSGYIATVDVEQQFHNPFDSKIEAVYQFPLPQDSAVSEFVMEVGPEDDRRQIRGIIREKGEAERIYNQARARGFNASLLTQVRPNIFEQKVANIEPGKQIDISIRYFNTLGYSDGWYSFT